MSRAQSAATTHVTRARSAIASSRRKICPLEQRNEDPFQGGFRVAHTVPQRGKVAERNHPSFGEHQDAVGNVFRVGELVNARDNRSRGPDRVTHGPQNLSKLQRIERGEGLVEHGYRSPERERAKKRNALALTTRKDPNRVGQERCER
jgi:hypothetical protein